MTRLHLVQGQRVAKTDKTLISRVAFCNIEQLCEFCENGNSPPFLELSIGSISGGQALTDNLCDSCLSILDDYIVEIDSQNPCKYSLRWCQCDVFQQGTPRIEAEIIRSGSDIILRVTFVVGFSFPTIDTAVYDITLPSVTEIDCQNLDLTLAFNAGLSSLNNLCDHWEDQEVFLKSFFFHQFEERFEDCPFCVWETDANIMEVRLGELDPGTSPTVGCPCEFGDEWIALFKVPGLCCEWRGSIGEDPCLFTIRLVIAQNLYFLQVVNASTTDTHQYVLEPDYPFNCQSTFTLFSDGTFFGDPDLICKGWEDITPEVRPVQTSFRFSSFEANYIGSLGGLASLGTTFSSFSTNYTGSLIIAGDVSQSFNSFEQDYTGSVVVSGDTSQEFKSFGQAYLAGQGPVTGDLGVTHSSFESNYSGAVKPIAVGNLSQVFNSFGQSYSGKVINKGVLSVEHSSFSHDYTGKVIVSGDLALDWTSFEQQYIGTVSTADPCAEPGSECTYQCDGGGGNWTEISNNCNPTPGDCVCGDSPPAEECVEFVNEGEERQVPCVTSP